MSFKLIVAVAVSTAALGLAACGGEAAKPADPAVVVETPAAVVETPAPAMAPAADPAAVAPAADPAAMPPAAPAEAPH